MLEHIEPDLVENVLAELGSITHEVRILFGAPGAGGKVLADGRNAHLIQKPTSWWLPKMVKHFEILQLQAHQIMGHGFWVVVKPVEKSASN